MAGATYVLDKTYKVTESAGVTKYRAVIPGTNDGECKLPTAVNQLSCGITQEAQAKVNENVTLRKYGISRAYAKGVVTKGDYIDKMKIDDPWRKVTGDENVIMADLSELTDGQTVRVAETPTR